MKTSYTILWIDDEPDKTKEDQAGVEEFLKEFEIRAEIDFVKALKDGSIHSKIKDYLKNPDLDILIVDYHMDGLNGDKLVSYIRESDHVYLPVIFYSSINMDEIYSAVWEKKLDGVYITSRRFFIEKFKNVVTSLLHKEQTIKQTRGLLMEGVSELDAQLGKIREQSWKKMSKDQRVKLIEYVRKNIIEARFKNTKEKVDNFPDNDSKFSDHMTKDFLSPEYDTYARWRIVKKVLEFLEKHHNPEKCVKIRKELRRQQENIDRIIKK